MVDSFTLPKIFFNMKLSMGNDHAGTEHKKKS